MRRDLIPFTNPINHENFEGWHLEPELRINLAERTVSGAIRYYGATTRKFHASKPFTITIGEVKVEGIVDAICTKLINQNPALAGTRVVEEVEDVNQDVA